MNINISPSRGIDLVVVGSHGQSNPDNTLLGVYSKRQKHEAFATNHQY